MFLTKQKKNSKKNNTKNNNTKNNNTKNNKNTIKMQNGRQKGGAGAEPAPNIKDLAEKQNFKYIKIKDNGWCFYYAILQGLSPNPDQPATIDAGKYFLVEIADWFKKNKDTQKSIIQGSWETFITSTDITVKNEISGSDENKTFNNYDEFLETLSKTQKNKTEDSNGFYDPGPLIWGDLDMFGQAIADIKNTNLILYELKDNVLSKKAHTPVISPQTGNQDTKTINLVYINGNHFDLLVPNTTPSPPDPPPDPPSTTKPKISFCYV